MKTIDAHKIIGTNGHLQSLINEATVEEEREISTELINSDKGFNSLCPEWNRLAERAGSHIFQSYEWQRLWWKHFGGGHQLHIITFRHLGKLIGIVPFYLEKKSLFFKFNYLRLRFIGSSTPSSGSSGTFLDYSPSDYLDVIVSPDYEDQITEILLLYLEKAGDQFNQVDFDEISEDSFMIRKVVPELKKRSWSFTKIKREMCPRIELPASMEEYLKELPSKTRYELRYSKRAETEKKVFQVKNATTRKQTKEAFEHFVRIHQERWNREGLPGAFADGDYTRFLKEVTEVFYLKGWMRIKTIQAENECIAVDYAFIFNNRTYDYQKAFDSTSTLSKYGPGKTLMYDLIEQSIEEGRTVLDLLRGGEKYKIKIANDFRQNWKIIIPNGNEKRGIKYRLHNFFSRLKHLYGRSCREWLILRIHIKQWGFLKFLPNYLVFQKKRLSKLTLET